MPFTAARADCSARPPRPQPASLAASAQAWHPLAAVLLASLPAAAEDAVPGAAAAQPGSAGINVIEVVILVAPLLLYGIFNLYRDNVNPSAKARPAVLAVQRVARRTR